MQTDKPEEKKEENTKESYSKRLNSDEEKVRRYGQQTSC